MTLDHIAAARIPIDQCRLLTLHATRRMDTVGNTAARTGITEIRGAVPGMACQVVDWAIQAHGGAGVTEELGLAYMYKIARTLRIVDGLDEVHRFQLGRMELNKHRPPRNSAVGAAA